MTPFLMDARHALRSLLKSPAFAIAAVLTLALGIGANTAIFSLVDRLLLRSLPFPQAERLAVATEVSAQGLENLSYPDFLDFQREATSFSGLAALQNGSVNLTGDGAPQRLIAGRVSWNLFEVLGVAPLHGRTFTASEGEMNGPLSVVLSHALWTRRFGADPSLVGRTLRLNGEAVVVAGVMPPDFEMPYQLRGVEVFLPLRLTPDQQRARGNHFLGGVGRLKPGVSMDTARREAEAIFSRLEAAYPDTNRRYRAKVLPLQEEVVARFRPVLLLLQAAVAFVLLIACANVANLLLARSAARERELAIRAALGADRRRLVAQLLTESLLLAAAGAGLGLLIAALTLDGLTRILPLPLTGSASMDLRLLGFTLLTSLGSVGLFGLIPAWQVSRPNLAEGLREGAKGTASPAQRRLRQSLVAAEVALATALLIGAGLMVRSLWSLQRVDPGFRPEGVLTAGVALPEARYPDGAARSAFIARLVDRAAQIPGVTHAAAVSTLPFGGSTTTSTYSLDGRQEGPDAPMAQLLAVTPDFFEAFGLPLLRGRTFQGREQRGAIVTAAFAARHWPGQDPLGHRLSFGGDEGPWYTILGVAGDLRTVDLAKDPKPAVFLSILEGDASPFPSFSLVLRGTGSPEALKPGAEAAMRELDPELPLARVLPMTGLLDRQRRASESNSLLFTAFGALALLLSAVGIFGVTSFLVTQRTREIGIRMALGAQVRDVLALIVGQGLRTLLLGLAAGLAVAVLLGRALQGQLFGVTALDPGTYAAVLVLLTLVGLLASLLPALRAAKVDPAVALRSE